MGNVKSLPVSLPFSPNEIPSVRIGAAIANRSNKDLAFVVGGGIGDRVCAEPTLSFALDTFHDCRISLICETPELFSHLHFHEIFDLKRTHPVSGRHLYLNTYPLSGLFNQFVNPNLAHCVDFPSLAALRMQLPIEYRQLQIPLKPPAEHLQDVYMNQAVVVHPGKSWPSRTFPAAWWNKMIRGIDHAGYRPVIVGSVTVDGLELPYSAVDLRGKTDVPELAWLCSYAYGLVTNDSAPLHLGAPGDSRIAYVSTCRNGELLKHHRSGGFGWRMRDFCRREVWREYDFCPNHLEGVHVSELPKGVVMDALLPEPEEIIHWIKNER